MTMDFLYGGKPSGWPMEVAPYATFGTTSVAVVDTDGDGTAEVAVASDSTAWMFRYDDGDGDGEVDVNGAWPAPALGSRLFGTPVFSPTLGDLDGDGNFEMMVATDSGAVHVFRSNGSPYGGADSVGVLFTLPVEQRLTWEVVPADLDGDGADELYTVHADGMLRGYDASGGTAVALFTPRPILGPDVDVPPDLIATLAFADLDGDGGLDGLLTYLLDDTVNLHLFGRDGRRSWRRSYPMPDGHEGDRVWVAIGDIVRDRANVDPEILLATEGGWLQLYDSLGEPLPGWPRQVPPRLGGPPALGDIDGDGLLEVVVASNAHVVSAFNYNGTLVPGWPVAVPLVDFPGLGTQAPGPAIADVDGDGYQDVIVGLVDFNVHALDRFGKPVLGFPIVSGGPVVTTPAIVDGNGDGRLELYVHSTDGQVYARILPGQPSATNPQWSMYGNGPRHHSSYDVRRLPLLVTNDALFAGSVQVYPNPVSNNHGAVSIRYTLGTNLVRASGVVATIYNIAGEEVRRLSGTAEPNTENVITLPVSELASGVYLCSLKARSGDREETRLEKFAVIR
jgi:hypothetical protein